MSMKYKSVLTEAESLVHGERNADYGHPLDDFTRTAKMWSAYKGVEFKPEDVPVFMMLVKLSRESNKPKRDNCVDIAGYAETLEWCKYENYLREVLIQTFGKPEHY